MASFFTPYKQQIVDACKKYKVNRLFAFGSVLSNRFNDQSDVDLIVDFNKSAIDDYFDNYFDFKYLLESIFKRDVDLLEDRPINNSFLRKSIESTKTLIYG